MSLTRVLALAWMLAIGVFAQSTDSIVGKWVCNVNTVTHVPDGRSAAQNYQATFDFRPNHTAVVVGGDQDGELVGQWTGGASNMTLAISDKYSSGGGRAQGSVTGGVMRLNNHNRFADGTTDDAIYNCRSKETAVLEPTVNFRNRYAMPIDIEVYECKTSFPSTRDEILRDLVLQPGASTVVSCKDRVGLCFRWRITDKNDSFGSFYGADCNVHPPGSHDAFDNPERQKIVTP